MASKTVVNQTRMFNNIPTTPHYDFQFRFEQAFKHQDVSLLIRFKISYA